MTRMADDEHYDERPRSIFSALWFRVLLVVLVLGVAAVLAVPYVLDLVSLPSMQQTASVQPPLPAPPPSAASQPLPDAPPLATPPGQPEPGPPTSPGEAAKPEPLTAPPTESEKPAPVAEEAKPVAKAIESAKPRMEGRIKPSVTRSAVRGPFWVQVGAFRDADAAKRLAERLRADNYSVQESAKPEAPAAAAPSPSPGPSDQYNVFVSGAAPADLDSRLSAKGLAAEAVAGGVMVKPSLPLRDAVTLSRELAGEGLRVQVRRAVSDPAPAAAPSTAAGGDSLHRVRVGSFPDRGAAMVVLKELQAKGYKPFLARGGP